MRQPERAVTPTPKGPRVKRIIPIPIVAAIVMLMAVPALAGDRVNEAATRLKSTHVFVAGDAQPSLTQAEVQGLEDQIGKTGKPIYVAVLNDAAGAEAGNNYDNLPGEIGKAKGGDAVIGVVAGTHFRAGANSGVGLQKGQAGTLATSALNENNPKDKGSIAPMLSSWVDKVSKAFPGAAKTGTPTVAAAGSPAAASGGISGWFWFFIITMIVMMAVGAVVFFAVRRVREDQRRAEEEQADYDRQRKRSREEDEVAGGARKIYNPEPDQIRNYSSDYPVPSQTQVVNINYPGYNYGYHSGSGWGYYDHHGGFVEGMLYGQAMSNHRHDHHDHDHHRDDQPNVPSGIVSNGGDWEPTPVTNGGDWNGDGEPSSNGGDWDPSPPASAPEPEPYRAPEPSHYEAPAYHAPEPSYSAPSYSGGSDWGSSSSSDSGGGGGGGGDW
jgi:uncharacterized membrane protein YgcG